MIATGRAIGLRGNAAERRRARRSTAPPLPVNIPPGWAVPS